MSSDSSVFIVTTGDYDNLGVGYLMSMLSGKGIKTSLVDCRYGGEEILAHLRRHDPLIIGFSVVYEECLEEFTGLAQYLRNGGITCHFTAGGSYASLRPDELFNLMPELDSIVRFEGEDTFTELVECIATDSDWRHIRSIAFRDKGKTMLTPLRFLEKDIDRFPFPVRRPLDEFACGRKFATILAGRGCLYDCSFCNTREFYGTPGGPLKRIRKPEAVVSEMEQLYHEQTCSVFLFQDDDFPLKTPGVNDWTKSFCNELERKGLKEKTMWKINCRPDEIDAENFYLMKQHGLFLVFIGIEEGTEEGLIRINKRLTVAEIIRGVEILKNLGLGFDYGFMLFQPETDYSSLRKNLKFLNSICDNMAPVELLKLLPYFDTRVEKELRDQGRIKGRPGHYDYDFLDESLTDYYQTVRECFAYWLWDAYGLTNLSKWARNKFAVYDRFGTARPDVESLKVKFRNTLTESNRYILGTLSDLVDLFESGSFKGKGSSTIERIKAEAEARHSGYCKTTRECFIRDA
jgi:radical SAM superfamily enzyme YgiQ (UPF0313 family)